MVNIFCWHHSHWMIYVLLMTDLVVVNGQHICPLWHFYSKDGETCECCKSIEGLIRCEKEYVYVAHSHCLTWNNTTRDVEVSRCLYAHQDENLHDSYNWYSILSNVTGPKLNNLTCKPYNRHGPQCRFCINGYGPAAFSDGASCADCSKHKYLWLMNLIFQLMAVTLLYFLVILFQIKGTCSPFNIIITNCQLGIAAIMAGSALHTRIIRVTSKRFTTAALTLIGVLNLDFFRFIIPPICINSSLKSVHVLLFDYIVAVYPVIVTIVIYVAIELHDRNWRIVVWLSVPFRLLWCKNWRPKETILSTCATFLLLSYSKFLFVSISLLFNIRTYNCEGEIVLNSSVLLYDPSVRFLSLEHVPYVVLALAIIVVFVLLPPLLLLLYPTRLFRKCLNCCGFRRWDILHLVMDVFQGWYKDGTEGTYDFRSFSALYMILRIVLSFAYFKLMVSGGYILFRAALGSYCVLLWVIFLVLKPYKLNWMNYTDGAITLMLAFFILTYDFKNKIVSYIGIVFGFFVTLIVCLYYGYKCFRKFFP